MKNKLTKVNLLLCLAIMTLLTLFSCNVAKSPAELEAPALEEGLTQATDISSLKADQSFIDSISLDNGMSLNEYLTSRDMTIDELYQEVYRDISSSSSRGINDFIDLEDVLLNPSSYFTGKITPRGSIYIVEVGVSKTKLNESLRRIPVKRIGTYKYGYSEISNFYVDNISSSTISIKARIKLKYKRGIISVSPKFWIRFELSYQFDSTTNSLLLKKARCSVEKTSNLFLKLLIKGLRVFGKELHITQNINQSLPLDFLPRNMLTFSKLYTNNNFITIQFIVPKFLHYYVIQHAKVHGFILTR